MYCSTACHSAQPFGCQNTRPGASGCMWKRSSCVPRRAVVALLGLLQHLEVGVLVFLLAPGGAVDALEHLVLRVSAPVGAGDAHQLEGLELAGGRHVRAAAQVDPVALAVERNRVLLRDRGDDLGFVFLALLAEKLHGFVTRHLAALDRQILLGDLGHALFDRREIFRRERPLVREVVVEAVLDHRADGDLRIGKQLLHRVREQMRGRVADDVDALGIALGDDLHRRVALDTDSRCRPACRRPCRRARRARGPGRSTRRSRLR